MGGRGRGACRVHGGQLVLLLRRSKAGCRPGGCPTEESTHSLRGMPLRRSHEIELAAGVQVRIDLSVPSSSQASTGRRGAASAASSSPGSDAPPGFAPRPAAHAAPTPAAAAPTLAPGQQARGVPVPLPLAPGSSPAGAQVALPVPPHAVAGLAVLPPAPCAYCQGPHSMKNCRDFHHMLQSIYQVCACGGLPAWQCMLVPSSRSSLLQALRTLPDPSTSLCIPGHPFLLTDVSFHRACLQAGFQQGVAAAQQAQHAAPPPPSS